MEFYIMKNNTFEIAWCDVLLVDIWKYSKMANEGGLREGRLVETVEKAGMRRKARGSGIIY